MRANKPTFLHCDWEYLVGKLFYFATDGIHLCNRIGRSISLLANQHPCLHQRIIWEFVSKQFAVAVSDWKIRTLLLEAVTALDIYPLGSTSLLSGYSDALKLVGKKITFRLHRQLQQCSLV